MAGRIPQAISLLLGTVEDTTAQLLDSVSDHIHSIKARKHAALGLRDDGLVFLLLISNLKNIKKYKR